VVTEFLARCEGHRVPSIAAMQPMHVAGYIEELTRAIGADRQAAASRDPPSIRLACGRPGHAGEPGRVSAPAEPQGQDAGAIA